MTESCRGWGAGGEQALRVHSEDFSTKTPAVCAHCMQDQFAWLLSLETVGLKKIFSLFEWGRVGGGGGGGRGSLVTGKGIIYFNVLLSGKGVYRKGDYLLIFMCFSFSGGRGGGLPTFGCQNSLNLMDFQLPTCPRAPGNTLALTEPVHRQPTHLMQSTLRNNPTLKKCQHSWTSPYE